MKRFELKLSLVEIIYKLKKSGCSSIADESRQFLFEQAGKLSKFRATAGRTGFVVEDLLQHPPRLAIETGKLKRSDESETLFDQLLENPNEWSSELEFPIRMPTCGAHNHGHQISRMHFDIRETALEIKHRMEVRLP